MFTFAAVSVTLCSVVHSQLSTMISGSGDEPDTLSTMDAMDPPSNNNCHRSQNNTNLNAQTQLINSTGVQATAMTSHRPKSRPHEQPRTLSP